MLVTFKLVFLHLIPAKLGLGKHRSYIWRQKGQIFHLDNTILRTVDMVAFSYGWMAAITFLTHNNYVKYTVMCAENYHYQLP